MNNSIATTIVHIADQHNIDLTYDMLEDSKLFYTLKLNNRVFNMLHVISDYANADNTVHLYKYDDLTVHSPFVIAMTDYASYALLQHRDNDILLELYNVLHTLRDRLHIVSVNIVTDKEIMTKLMQKNQQTFIFLDLIGMILRKYETLLQFDMIRRIEKMQYAS